MKLAQKIYLISLIVFLAFFELGIYAVTYRVYDLSCNQVLQRTLQQYNDTVDALHDELTQLDQGAEVSQDEFIELYSRYVEYYRQRDTYMALYRDGEAMTDTGSQPELDQVDDSLIHAGSSPVYEIKKINGVSQLYLARKQKAPYESYVIVYTLSMKDVDALWNSMQKFLIPAGAVAFAIFACILGLIINHMLRPLKTLSDAVDKMAEGDVLQTIPTRGHDEVAVLGDKFSSMSRKVSEQMETIERDAQGKQTFIHNLSHEMRTPLTAIYGYAELMDKTEVTTEEKKEYLGYIMGEADRIKRMSETLLKLNLLQVDQTEYTMTDIEKLLSMVKHDIRSMTEEADIHVNFQVDIAQIYGDEVLLESLIINLIQNAVRASAAGSRVDVSMTGEPRHARIDVKDYGIGIAEEELKKICEPFYRVDKARSRKAGGAGLGLALCKKIVECHNGTLTYQSVQGKGTTARVELFTTL